MNLGLELLLAGLRLTISAGMPGDGGDDVCEGVDGNGDGDSRYCALSRKVDNSVITVVVLSQSLNTLIAFDLGKRLSAALPRSLCEVCFLCHLMFGGWWGWLLSLFFCSQLTFYHRRHSSSAVNVSDGEGL